MSDKELKDEVMDEVSGGLLKKAYKVNSTGDDTKIKCLMCGYEFEESEMFKPRTCPECGGHYLSNMDIRPGFFK